MTLPFQSLVVVRGNVQSQRFRLSIPAARCALTTPHREPASVRIRCGSGRAHRGLIAVLASITGTIQQGRNPARKFFGAVWPLRRQFHPLIHLRQKSQSGVFQTLKSLFVWFVAHVEQSAGEFLKCLTKVVTRIPV